MGRMWDALRRDDSQPRETEQPRAIASPPEDAEPILATSDEIPFIEVGPRRSVEASPSVLACSRGAGREVRGENEFVSSLAPRPAPLAPQTSRKVRFRAVPGRNGRSSFAPELVAYHAADERAAQQYSEVFDSILKACPTSDRPASFLFTSSRSAVGNTTALLNVAITAAVHSGKPVVVVDANFRKPAVAERLGLPAAPGLREAMAGAVALEEVIQETEQVQLFAVTAGIREASGVRFVAETLRSLLRQLSQRYPLVFVDGPCWDSKPDVTMLGAACDSVFLVTPETQAETAQIDSLLQLIPTQGARLGGCILVADQ